MANSFGIDVRLSAKKPAKVIAPFTNPLHQVNPGDSITSESGFMRGHGTYFDSSDILASVAGTVQRVNKLICVKPLKTRYFGEVGDVVVGRITEVGNKRWRVETHSILNSVLLLSSVNLPGGELRKRSSEDERLMREYLQEGDLISAEVQSVHTEGTLSLATRSLKYGKLGQGILIQVSPSLVKRCKNHIHNLHCGATLILGNNGYIWICPQGSEKTADGGYVQNLEAITELDRSIIVRLRNCVLTLAHYKTLLYDTSILYAYDSSAPYNVSDILKPENMLDIISMTRSRIEAENM